MSNRIGNMLARTALIGAMLGASAVFCAAAPEYQPDMEAAMQSLRQAEAALQHASSDKGGHRLRAMNLVREAEQEVQAGIEYDNRHRSPGERGERGGYRGSRWQGHLSGDDQKRFDSYYTRWVNYNRDNNRDQVGSMEKRMREIMARYNIPGDVPFDEITTNPR